MQNIYCRETYNFNIMKSTAQKWPFFLIMSLFLATRADALSNGTPQPGQKYRNPYTEVNYDLTCGLPFQTNCGTYSLEYGCRNVNCFPYLRYDNDFGIAVDINGGMTLVFDYCSRDTENCVPANLGMFSKCLIEPT